MAKENSFTLGLIIASILLIIGGAVFFTKPKTVEQPRVVSSEILVRSDSSKIVAPNEQKVLVEFGDFQCPACAAYHDLVKSVLEENKDSLTFVFRNFPLSQHKYARQAAYAAEAAGVQGKYWEMYAKLYENQTDWVNAESPVDTLLTYAKELRLDETKFKSDMDSKETKDKVDRDYVDGVAAGVDSTPTFFVNGTKIDNPSSAQEFKSLIESL